jgi:hypothetical protein
MTWFSPISGADHSIGARRIPPVVEREREVRYSKSVTAPLPFLAIRGGATSQAAVAGTLRPDATETHAYSNLRSALARLERTLR